METNEMQLDVNMLAYCGLYCGQCSVRTAFEEQDWKHMEGFPAKYKRAGAALSDYDCGGCKGRNLCGPCVIKDCAAPRGFTSCAECDDFPCGKLAAFGADGIPHHARALENLRCIRADGLEAWFQKVVKPVLRCPCGERQSWYYVCPKHG